MSPRFFVQRRACDALKVDEDIVLRRGETITLYYHVRPREQVSGVILCSDLATSNVTSVAAVGTSLQSWSLSDLQDLTKKNNNEMVCTNDVSRLLCLDHVRSMESAMRAHKKRLKKIENELIGPAIGQLSIEEVRRRNQKLSQMKADLGMSEEDEKIPSPWGSDALAWNAQGTIHLMALWETLPLQEGDEVAMPSLLGMTTQLRVPVRPDRPDPKNPTRTCPLMLSCIYPETVVHSFCSGKERGAVGEGDELSSPCVDVPIVVRVTNGAPIGSNPIMFVLEVQNEAECTFRWSGPTKRRLTLSPSESTDVRLSAHFYSPGTYNLNQFRFHVDVRKSKRDREEMIPFKFPSLKYLVKVEERDHKEREI